MALRVAALIAFGSAAGASAGPACPTSTNPMISAVTDTSPECFKQCPQMCQPLDGLISEYMATSDKKAITAKVCADPTPFSCMFEGNHLDACGKIIAMGSTLGVQLPMSAAQLQEQCSSSNLRGGGARQGDVALLALDAGNSTNGTDSTDNTDGTDGTNIGGSKNSTGGEISDDVALDAGNSTNGTDSTDNTDGTDGTNTGGSNNSRGGEISDDVALDAGNSTNGTDSTNNTDGTDGTNTGGSNNSRGGETSAAGGRGVVGTAAVRLLGFLAPVALLFVA